MGVRESTADSCWILWQTYIPEPSLSNSGVILGGGVKGAVSPNMVSDNVKKEPSYIVHVTRTAQNKLQSQVQIVH